MGSNIDSNFDIENNYNQNRLIGVRVRNYSRNFSSFNQNFKLF
jgi:hypothetical protein